MYDVKGHFVILIGAAVAICVMSYFTGLPHRVAPAHQETAAIVIVPHHTTESETPPTASPATASPATASPATASPATAQVPSVPVRRDMASLTREIQRELKRVGCYDGEIDGRWNPRSRAAMKTFADQVNAELPIDRPDYVLLRLVQVHQGKACSPSESNTARPTAPSLLYEGRMRSPSAKMD
jgi:hypothetical protein